MLRIATIMALMALALGACSTEKQSSPPRTATEQLLISTAADRAVDKLNLSIPAGTKVFVDASNFEGTDSKYAIATVRDHLLRQGVALVPKREAAQAVVELRAGALSIDEKETLVGIKSFDVPIPLTSSPLKLPEVALYKETERKGIAKIAATAYATADGKLIDSSDPAFGYSHKRKYNILLFFSWRSNDLPKEKNDELIDQLRDEW